MYDGALGRFMNVDPHSESYYGITPYNYAVNNPVLLIDPDGKDAVVSINGNTITVTTNIFIYGSGASNEEAKKIQDAINSYWGQSGYTYADENGNEFEVSFETNVRVYDGNDSGVIEETWDKNNTDNFIKVVDGEGRSHVKFGDEGVWYTKGQSGEDTQYFEEIQTWTYGHEFGHLLGLKDRYSTNFLTRESTPDDGYEGQIMGGVLGTVDTRALEGVVKDSVQKYNRFVEKYGSEEAKKKTFTTKIDIAFPSN